MKYFNSFHHTDAENNKKTENLQYEEKIKFFCEIPDELYFLSPDFSAKEHRGESDVKRKCQTEEPDPLYTCFAEPNGELSTLQRDKRLNTISL